MIDGDRLSDADRGGGFIRDDGAALPPILLDVSRLVSRIGSGHPTGVDRVEAAWLGHLASRPQHHLLCRTRLGQLILPADAAKIILKAVGMAPDGRSEAVPTGPARRSMLPRSWQKPRVEAALFRAARACAGRQGKGLAAALERAGVSKESVYLNTGHANLTEGLLSAIPLPRAVLIHDAIPLDHPQWARQGQDRIFQTRLQAVFDHAGLVLTVSRASADRLQFWCSRLKPLRAPPIVAAPIGTGLAQPDPGQPTPPGSFFLTIGTVEPRKNHALLLDAWAKLADPPTLIIAGRRGWRNDGVFARLDAMAPGKVIREFADLSDAAIAALMTGTRALLFPSHAEGFGLPLTEAAARGVPILAQELPSTREILGGYPRYLPDDPAIWAGEIAAMANAPLIRQDPASVPTWDGHFRMVAEALNALPEGERAR